VSTDTHFTHKAWAETSDTIAKVKFPMLADPTHKLARDFGVLLEDEGIALRGSFIINPQGEIVAYEVHRNDIGRSCEELIRKVQAAQFVSFNVGKVLPAEWKPGKEAITLP
jgi:peroxiredoxin (alkyl hydroperoxide reductase subunit C)